jgi:hypothetical protein
MQGGPTGQHRHSPALETSVWEEGVGVAFMGGRAAGGTRSCVTSATWVNFPVQLGRAKPGTTCLGKVVFLARSACCWCRRRPEAPAAGRHQLRMHVVPQSARGVAPSARLFARSRRRAARLRRSGFLRRPLADDPVDDEDVEVEVGAQASCRSAGGRKTAKSWVSRGAPGLCRLASARSARTKIPSTAPRACGHAGGRGADGHSLAVCKWSGSESTHCRSGRCGST